MLTSVILYGELEEKFGKRFEGVAHTPREALRMLYHQQPKIKDHFIISPNYYQLVLLDSDVPILPSTEIKITGKRIGIIPVVEGNGFAKNLIGGLALVGIGVLTGGTSLIVAGAVMAAQSLFFGHGDSPDEDETKRSEVLGLGSLNTAEGNPIPVVYGNEVLVIGLQVLSFAVKSEYTSL